MKRRLEQLHGQHGSTMIEVLVTIVILTLGLFGLAGLQARMQTSEMESYQRAQALILINDMANRITTNRSAAASYVTVSPVGVGMTCPAATLTSSRQVQDSSEWCGSLQGAGELVGTSRVGAMVGARGCVAQLGPGEFMITVAWQGLAPIAAPPEGVDCAAGQYDGAAGSPCVGDLCRRAVTKLVRIATL